MTDVSTNRRRFFSRTTYASDDPTATATARARSAVDAAATIALRANVFARAGRSTRRFIAGIGVSLD